MKKRALITGINGQDGAYLAKHLLENDYEVLGADRRRVDSFAWRLKELGIDDKIEHVYMDLLEFSNIFNVISKYRPNEIYNLGAQSFVATSFDQPILTADIDAIGPLRILESIRTIDNKIKFYQASTSEMFGLVQESIQNEETKFYPRSPYGVAKLYAHWIVKNYRESYNIFACSGILFNHESPYRGLEFVTKKITNQVAKIHLGQEDKLTLGNLNAKRDWGFAGDYVIGMHSMLQQKIADDYVLATGKSFQIREFVDLCFSHIGKKIVWRGEGLNEVGLEYNTGKTLVEVSSKFFRPAEVNELKGDYTKAKENLDWEPHTKLPELISIMMDYDLKTNKINNH